VDSAATKLETSIASGEFVVTAEIVPPLSATGARLIGDSEGVRMQPRRAG
jgi:hypothetical protein